MNPLPTRNSQLALRRADFRSVPEMLDYAARGETGVTFYSVRGEILSALAWREVRERAQVMARRLIGAGFAAGERILITADTWPGFFDLFFGAQYAGLLPVPVSIPLGIGGKEAYLDQLRRQLAASGAVAALGHRRSRRVPGRRGQANFPPSACMAAWPRSRRCRRSRSICGRSARRPLLHPVLVGQHPPSARRRRSPSPP